MPPSQRRPGPVTKRLLDVSISIAGLVLLSPVIALVALAVRIGVGRPVLFRQDRAGFGGDAFVMLKFRTMTDARDREGRLLEDRERLTRLGRAIRALSLDELPQLWNVARGDMSLVGPRPLLTSYVPLYSERHSRRHEVLPGITGWAQVNGRNTLSWPERLDLDVWYVDHRTLLLDLRILVRTLRKVLVPTGVNSSDSDTMPTFRGIEADDPDTAVGAQDAAPR